MKHATDHQDLQLGKWLGGAALGAVVMYMLDPDRGAPRRAQSGAKLRQLGRQTGDALDKAVHGFGARMGQSDSSPRGVGARDNLVRDDRYRSADPHGDAGSQRWAGEASARQNRVGGMLKKGAESIRRALSSDTARSGAAGYRSETEATSRFGSQSAPHAQTDPQSHSRYTPSESQSPQPYSEPYSQSHSQPYSQPYSQSDALSASQASQSGTRGGAMAPYRARGSGMRGAALAGGGVLGLAALTAPRSPAGIVMGLAALALLLRGSGKRPISSMLGHAGHAQPVEVEKTIRIDASPEQVFDLFANYENFPRYMSNVVEVRDLGNRRSHWIVKGPAGTQFAWNAVLTELSRPHRLAWESEPDAEVAQAGSILFEPLHGGTRVTVRMTYHPPAGAVGSAVASMLGRDPKRQMDEDLARMKSLVERGAMTHAGPRPGLSDSKFLH